MLFTRLLRAVSAPVSGPSLCAVCQGWGTQRVCARCVARFAVEIPRCRRCALSLPSGARVCGACLTEPPPFDAAVAAVDYAPPWDRLIAQFKFHDALDLAPALAARLAAAVRNADAPLPDVLLPVPLSRERLRERGHNQAWELARRLGRTLDRPAEAQWLLRWQDTPHQTALAPTERAANVRGAFAVEPLRRAAVRGRHIAVIDDVMTTGATFAEIARTLRQAGAAGVQVWAVARTPRAADRAVPA